MNDTPIKFDDGAAYERMMGVWSQLVGEVFLDWLRPARDRSWIDVGCGNGVFTELLITRTAPSDVQAVDPSPAQIAYARERLGAKKATFQIGDAMSLPFEPNSFDAAVMALVIFFVPEPAKGVSEMVRTVRPGGSISAYAWDLAAGGLPLEPIRREMIAMGLNPPLPPRPEASTVEGMTKLWVDAGLEAVETRSISVERTFINFDDLWGTLLIGPGIAPMIASQPPTEVETMKERLRQRMPADEKGRITYSAVANAVKGRKRIP